MKFTSGKSRTTETVMSILLLVVISLIAVAVFVRQFHYDTSIFQISQTARELPDTDSKLNMTKLVPSNFKPASPLESYNSDSLYEKINGKADLYLESGFDKLDCQRFADKTDPQLWIELLIYNMQTPKAAFAVFSQQRRADSEPLNFTSFAYATPDAVFLACDRCYIEIKASAVSDQLTRTMTTTAANIAEKLEDDQQLLETLNLFPQNNLVPNSHKFYTKNVFGFDGLNNVFSAQYSVDGQSAALFMSKRADQAQAKIVADAYFNFLIENGAKKLSATTNNVPGRMVDFYDTIELIFTDDQFIAGIHAAGNPKTAETLAVLLHKKLQETVNSEQQTIKN